MLYRSIQQGNGSSKPGLLSLPPALLNNEESRHPTTRENKTKYFNIMIATIDEWLQFLTDEDGVEDVPSST
jgi:hypothetical protein